MLDLLIIPTMAVLSAWSGGSLWPSQYLPKNFTMLPEAAFALCCAIPYMMLPGAWATLLLPVALWCYGWHQSSPAPALHWGDLNHYNPDKKSTLKPFVDWLNKLGPDYHPSSVNYCRLYIGVKGFLTTLPVGGLGAIGYPIAYGFKNHTVRELLAGASAGLSAYLFLAIIQWLV